MGRIDFAGIADALLANAESFLAQWYPAGRIDGHEFCIGSVAGEAGQSLRVNIKEGVWSDFSGGGGGSDLISLYAARESISQGEAAKILGDELRLPRPAGDIPKAKPESKDTGRAEAILGVPAGAPAPSFRHRKLGEPSKVWPYPDGRGGVLMYVCRFNLADGGKEVLPRCWARFADGNDGWAWTGPRGDTLRPLYGLDQIVGVEPGTCVIVEGEKTADAARRLLPTWPALAWAGGCPVGMKGLIDLEPLRGWKVILIPDADYKTYPKNHKKAGEIMPVYEQPGERAMLTIARLLGPIAAGIRLVRTPWPPPKDGWDLADGEQEGWTQEQTRKFVLDGLRAVEPIRPAEPEPEPAQPEPPPHEHVPEAPPPEHHEPPAEALTLGTFRALGYNKGLYYYFGSGPGQVVEIGAASHNKLQLLQLAPLTFWEREFPGEKGTRWDAAADACMRACHQVGVFDPARIRGRGCWWDGDRLVVHLGDRLVVEGRELGPAAFDSRWIYETSARMPGPAAEPMTTAEARLVIEIAKRFQWEMPASAALLSGWIALAPICGALGWRPHVWLSGGPGSGKTTVLEHFVAPLLAGTEIRAQGNSTEPGIRQSIRADARPVILDEAESDDERQRARIDGIITMIRQSSSESDAKTYKGGAGGEATAYHVRSMFCLASVNVRLPQEADRTRISVLTLRSGKSWRADEAAAKAEHWRTTEAALIDLRDREGFAGRLLARMVALVPVVRANIRTFSRIAAPRFGSQRMGDQYGALLAGCAALWTERELSEAEAKAFIDRFDWKVYVEESQSDDAMGCLSSILQAAIRIDQAVATHTLGELVAVVAGRPSSASKMELPMAIGALGRHGLRVDMEGDVLLVANNSDGLAKLMRDRPWSTTWVQYLRRVRDAQPHGPVQFAPGHTQRCTAVPLSIVFGDGQPAGV